MGVTTMNAVNRVTVMFILIISALFWALPLNARAQTCQELITNGEQSLYSEDIDSILVAHATFKEAASMCPNDPIINGYLALTRLLYLAFTYDSVGVTPLLNQYGISRTGIDIDSLKYELPLDDNDKYDVPQGAPTGETIRAYMQNELLNAVNASIANLNVTIDNWSPVDKHIAVIANTGRDQDIELDWGDAWIFRSFLKAFKSIILIITAYDLDVDLREMAAKENLEALELSDLLDRYQSFLKLLPQASNMSVNGSALLDQARLSLIEAIDDYMVASGAIRNDTDLTAGAEELVEIDECDYRVEAWMRNILDNVRSSLSDPSHPDVLITKTEEEWILTDDAPVSRFEIYIYDLDANSSDANYDTVYGQDYVGGGGDIICITVNGSDVYLKGESQWWPYTEIEFTGTLNSTGDQMNGTYAGWNWDGAISGNFTAVRNRFEDKTEWINPNPAFGKGSAPNDVRDFLPQFNECDDPIAGTVGYGLNPSLPDSTLGGILLDFNQDDWGLDIDPCFPGDGTISGSLSIPDYSGSGTIFIQAFFYFGWFDLDPSYRVSMTTIYENEFAEGMTYSLDYVPTGYPLFVSAWWDLDADGIFDIEDVEVIPPPITPQPGDNPLDLEIGVDIWCQGDYDDDSDVDGSDLTAYIADSQGILLEIFARNYGRINCSEKP